uniref:SMP-30/Gluconolactonase/LRE-like region domain-containing protein n=1 Tax=Oryza glumipatula TaxID=40148 RepID=A0A0E0BB18_9ORYZ
MCGDCCGASAGGAAEARAAGAGGGRKRGCVGTALALVALAAAAAVAVLEGTAGGVSYVGDGWLHECAKTLTGGACSCPTSLAPACPSSAPKRKGTDPDVAGRVALGLTVDAPRGRLLIVYTDRIPRFGYSAVAAYELTSWRRLFLTRLDGPAAKKRQIIKFPRDNAHRLHCQRRLFLVRLDRPGDSTLADDVAVDDEGNAYVTDAKGNKIWKVSPEGEPLSVIKNATFSQRPGWINNLVGLNGIVYHPSGYLLVIHTSGGDLFKVDPKTGSVRVVEVKGSLKAGDGLALLSPARLWSPPACRLVESDDDWETAAVTGRYVGPAHRIGSSATVKDGDVYINHIIGFGLGKKTHIISKAAFAPL